LFIYKKSKFKLQGLLWEQQILDIDFNSPFIQ
jgi:hypothetical protein